VAHAVAHKYEPRPGSLRGRHIFSKFTSNSTMVHGVSATLHSGQPPTVYSYAFGGPPEVAPRIDLT
jgi:hypothetical protein